MKNNSDLLVAVSGGLDSAMAAHLLKEEGHSVAGATMRLFDSADSMVREAARAASELSIPHHIIDCAAVFEEEVIRPFVRAYLRGATPNPCVGCNKRLKFGVFMDFADGLGIGSIATGHYANISLENGRYFLKKAVDEARDQSYMLYSLSPCVLPKVRLPLGDKKKSDLRELAASLNLSPANKPDSQDICFVPDGDYVEFIENYTGERFPRGDFLDISGNVIGRHKGHIRYTIGQRNGLGMGFGRRMFVIGKDAEKNTVTLAEAEAAELYGKILHAHDFNFIAIDKIETSLRASVKLRYRHKEQPATIWQISENSVRIEFDEPQRAITDGQAAVVYDGEYVLGGGEIETSNK